MLITCSSAGSAPLRHEYLADTSVAALISPIGRQQVLPALVYNGRHTQNIAILFISVKFSRNFICAAEDTRWIH